MLALTGTSFATGAVLGLVSEALCSSASASHHVEDPLLDLELRWLAARDAATLASYDDSGVCPEDLEALCDVEESLADEMALAPVTSWAGAAVKTRRLIEASISGPTGREEEIANTLVAWFREAEGEAFAERLARGTREELVMRGGAA